MCTWLIAAVTFEGFWFTLRQINYSLGVIQKGLHVSEVSSIMFFSLCHVVVAARRHSYHELDRFQITGIHVSVILSLPSNVRMFY